ncbi:MAG: 5-aminopentanamidase [Pseudonocardiales bacterium]|jgi:predicted amidohydrolase|nr:5-aminopentanamidase [Pseudonocardiales bacterium]
MLVGLAQLATVAGDVTANLERCLLALHEAHEAGCQLVVFPECALSGYMFSDRATALAAAVTADGDVVATLVGGCSSLRLYCVIGVLLTDGERLWNSALLIGPDGVVGRYDKTHVPQLGVDNFVEAGNRPYEVHETAIGRLGLQICYDWRFPEVTRTLALAGAELVAMPTCSPSSSAELADYIPRTRAVENAIFFVMVNRVGAEGPADFAGRSQAVDPDGRVLVDAGGRVGLVLVELDLDLARNKDRDQGDGLYQLHLMKDRRPDLYRL